MPGPNKNEKHLAPSREEGHEALDVKTGTVPPKFL
jgi:hypothetical protein